MWALAIALLALWVLAFVVLHVTVASIHVLLVIAAIAVATRLVRRHRVI